MKKYIIAVLCLLSNMNAPFRTFEIKDKICSNPLLEIKQPDGNKIEIPNAQILTSRFGFEKYCKKMEGTLGLGREYIAIGWDREDTFDPKKTTCFCGLFEILRNSLTSTYKPKTLYRIVKQNEHFQIEHEVKGQGLANFITSMSGAILSGQEITKSSLEGFHDFDYFEKSIIPLIELVARDLWFHIEIKRNRDDANGGNINFSFYPPYNMLTLSFE